MDDAAFIVWLRNLEHTRGRIGDSAADTASQEAWLETYFKREGDYYFIIETAGRIAVGAYGIYNVATAALNPVAGSSGRKCPAAVPSALLAFDLAFGRLGLTEVRVKTVSTNQRGFVVEPEVWFSGDRR